MRTFLVGVSLLFFALGVRAQDLADASEYESAGMSYNTALNRGNLPATHGWELGLEIGTRAFLGEYDHKAGFADWWALPAVDVFATYWMNRVVGLGFDVRYAAYKGQSIAGDTRAVFYSLSDELDEKTGFARSTGSYMEIGGHGTVDLGKAFDGDPECRYRLLATVGLGEIIAVQSQHSSVAATAYFALKNQWRINSHWAAHLTLMGSIIPERFDGKWGEQEANNFPMDLTAGALLGASYRF